MLFIFWFALFLVGYSYVLYPLIIYLLPASKIKSKNSNEYSTDALPNVAIVIAAYNEEIDIVERVENLLALDYPDESYTIYLGSDGSTDSTNSLVESLEVNEKKLKFYAYEERRGKASVLNDLCAHVEEDVLIFSDANTHFESDALQKLTVHFIHDEGIGGVCGELKIHTTESNENNDGIYWKYEKFLKVNESKINGLLGANGAIYAIRSNLYQSLDPRTIIDDFMIAMNVVGKGYRLIYEPQAIAHESAPESIRHEFKRRVRIGSGNYQAFLWNKHLWNPFVSKIHTFTYFSHKVLRWFTPHLLILCFILNLFFIDSPMYLLLFLIQLLIYFFSAFCIILAITHKLPKMLSLLVFFVSMNTALLMGFLKYLFSNLNPAWERTSR